MHLREVTTVLDLVVRRMPGRRSYHG
jgi:hypothetical protein